MNSLKEAALLATFVLGSIGMCNKKSDDPEKASPEQKIAMQKESSESGNDGVAGGIAAVALTGGVVGIGLYRKNKQDIAGNKKPATQPSVGNHFKA